MGNYIGTYNPDNPRDYDAGRTERIGSNGSAGVFIGLLVAAYVLDNRPQMMRAARWLRVLRERTAGPDWPAPIPDAGVARTRKAVQALVDFNYEIDGAQLTTVDLDGRRVLRGMQIKPPTDPLLNDLGTMFERYYDTRENVPLEPERVRRLAAFTEEALDHLQQSCWYDNLLRASDVFEYAAARGWPVHVG